MFILNMVSGLIKVLLTPITSSVLFTSVSSGSGGGSDNVSKISNNAIILVIVTLILTTLTLTYHKV